MFHYPTAAKAALLTLLASAALPAYGASYLDTRQNMRGEATSYTASLSEITQGDIYRTTRILDWRQPTLQLWFDLPASERTSTITLNLAADPLTRVPGHAPLQVQFNHDKPVPVMSNGRGFEAELSFDPAKARSRRNSLKITFPAPTGTDCVMPAHGKWSVDLSASTLSMTGRSRSANMSLREVEERLAQPALSPKRIGLIAFGPDATDMQALAAQGLALRTPDIPKFSVTDRGTDFNVLMVTRDRLFDYTDDPMILNSKGSRVFVPKGRPTQLIFTADTDADILETLKLFSVRHLPSARRPITSLGEIDMQSRLDSDRIVVTRKAKLAELGDTDSFASFSDDSWASGAKTYRFDVTDPANTRGEILLRLASSEDVAETSRLRVALNGETLGAAKLDRRRKSVIFDVPSGKLNATSNVLSLLPELDAKPEYTCPSVTASQPNFMVGQGSKLTLDTSYASPASELSRLAATGSVFKDQQSYIALPREAREFEASLRILGRLAKSAGQGLTEADYTRGSDVGQDRHILVIGSARTQTRVLGDMTTAPKALKQALQGQSISGENLLQSGIERFASAGLDDFAVQYAAAKSGSRKVSKGGVAALYGNGAGRMIGVISAAPSERFTTVASQIIEPDHWNALRGGVARWNKSSVIMAQTAQPIMGVSLRDNQGSSLLDFDFPNIDFPDFTLPDFEMPTVKMPEWSWPTNPLRRFNAETRTADAPANEALVLRQAPVHDISIEAKPVTMTAEAQRGYIQEARADRVETSEGLRGRFTFETPDMPDLNMPVLTAPKMSSFQDIRRATKSKWLSARRWSQDKVDSLMTMRSLKEIERRTDRLQNRVKPSGQKARKSLIERLPGKGVVQFADRTYSVFGILLILSFMSVVFLMSMASPSSRLGGRH